MRVVGAFRGSQIPGTLLRRGVVRVMETRDSGTNGKSQNKSQCDGYRPLRLETTGTCHVMLKSCLREFDIINWVFGFFEETGRIRK